MRARVVYSVNRRVSDGRREADEAVNLQERWENCESFLLPLPAWRSASNIPRLLLKDVCLSLLPRFAASHTGPSEMVEENPHIYLLGKKLFRNN